MDDAYGSSDEVVKELLYACIFIKLIGKYVVQDDVRSAADFYMEELVAGMRQAKTL